MVQFQLSEYKPTHSLSDFEFLHDPKDKRSKLGLGSFATVKLAREKKSGKLFALKLIDIHPSKVTKSDLDNLKTEILIHKDLNHPNVIKFHGYMQEGNTVYLVLDYAENGNLYSYHHRKKSLTEKEIFRFFHQTCLAINYLHDNDIVHRDIKPENLLLDKDFNIKICDFGWSAYDIVQERKTFCGTYEYMAPEIVNKKTYDHRVDVWAIGVLLYELMHNKAPFRGRTMQEIKTSLTNGEVVFSDDIPIDAKNLIQKILKNDPKHRMVITEILADPWIVHHLEREEVFRKTVYQDDLKQDNNKQQKLRIFDDKEEAKKKPVNILTDSVQQFFCVPAHLKKGNSVTSSSSTTNQSRPGDISPFSLNRTITNNFGNEKQSPKSAVLSANRIFEETRTPPKTGNQKRIFDHGILSPTFNNRLNRVINNLNSNNKDVMTQLTKENATSPSTYRIPDNKPRLNIPGSSGSMHENVEDNQTRQIGSKGACSFVFDETIPKNLNSTYYKNLEARSLQNVSNIDRQPLNGQNLTQNSPFLASKDPKIAKLDKKNEIVSKNNENHKVFGETARVRIFNDEPKKKLMSKLLDDFSFVKNLLSGPQKAGSRNKENTTEFKFGQRNL